MAFETISPNMNLPVPGVSLTDGPQWATDVNSCLTIIDGHTHASGSGVQVTPDGLNINADLSLNINNLINGRSVRFKPQGSPLSGAADLGCLYESGVDLYFNDGSGNQVRITQAGGVAGSPGSIANLASPASATYVGGNGSFVWQQSANTSADMDFGSAIMRNDTANSKAVTLSPAASLGTNYSLTLPLLPLAQQFMTLDSSGNMAAPWAVDNSTLEIASSTTLQVKDQGITAAKIANGTITRTQIVTNINLPGTQIQSNSKNMIVNNTNGADGLAIVRGSFASLGNQQNGEGYTSARTGSGTYSVSFTQGFADVPTVTVSTWEVTGTPPFTTTVCMVYGTTTGGFAVATQRVSDGALVNTAVQFTAIGVRAT